MKKIEDYNFNRNDWGHFHDVILDLTWDDGKVSLTQEEMEELFGELPEEMKIEADEWGMNDTLWRDKLWKWYKINRMA